MALPTAHPSNHAGLARRSPGGNGNSNSNDSSYDPYNLPPPSKIKPEDAKQLNLPVDDPAVVEWQKKSATGYGAVAYGYGGSAPSSSTTTTTSTTATTASGSAPPANLPCFDLDPLPTGRTLPTSEQLAKLGYKLNTSGVVVGQSHIGKWYILGKLGNGYFGDVFLAHDGDRSFAAVKVLKQLTPDWEREYNVQKALSDIPGVVKMLEIFNVPARQGFVMEAANDVDLIGLIKSRAADYGLEAPTARDILLQLAQALKAIHDRNYVLRDIKPDNVLLFKDPSGKRIAKFSDFGLASPIQDPVLTFVGHHDYRAPEASNYRTSPFDLVKADLFSFGCMIYEALSKPGSHVPRAASSSSKVAGPVDFTSPAYQTFLDMHKGDNWRPVIELVRGLLDTDPAKRPTAAQAITQLEAWTTNNQLLRSTAGIKPPK